MGEERVTLGLSTAHWPGVSSAPEGWHSSCGVALRATLLSYCFLRPSGVSSTLDSNRKTAEEIKQLLSLQKPPFGLARNIVTFCITSDNTPNDSFVSKHKWKILFKKKQNDCPEHFYGNNKNKNTSTRRRLISTWQKRMASFPQNLTS